MPATPPMPRPAPPSTARHQRTARHRRTRQPAPMRPPASDAPAGTGSGDEPLLATVDPERCALNQDAGTITYLSGFDFAAAGVDHRCHRGRAVGILRRPVPRRRAEAELRHGQLHTRGQRPSAVRLGRQLHRDPQLLGRGRRVRGLHRLRQDADRGPDHPGWWCNRIGRTRGQDDRREGRHPAVDRGDARRRRPHSGHRLRGGPARRIRSAGASRHRDRCAPRVQVERTRSARCGRRGVQPLRSG